MECSSAIALEFRVGNFLGVAYAPHQTAIAAVCSILRALNIVLRSNELLPKGCHIAVDPRRPLAALRLP